MSFPTVSLQRAFGFSLLPLKNFNWHLTLTRLFSSRSHYGSHNPISAESFYTSLLDKSTHIIHLRQIQSQLYTHGLQNNGFIITKLIHVSSNLKEIHYARQLFDGFPDQYVFLWNAIIRGYSMHNMFDSVVEMYSRMQQAFVSPDTFTFPDVLKACGSLLARRYGRAVHAQIFRHGLEEDVFVQNGLLSFYVK
ncbi:Pentatricopeptide repeat-containing protein [Sesamum angolense]|uniref:Pentatricopeptide repeat-containing protein n=1 Tax=Sesamum angolense TaxID=2727404 RepID=A0AAE1WR50_9LAMI|nr:Pentatricopeptide repeat-containing protein [Sesamum angolense]